MVDTRDLKSLGPKGLCRFESDSEYRLINMINKKLTKYSKYGEFKN